MNIVSESKINGQESCSSSEHEKLEAAAWLVKGISTVLSGPVCPS